MKIKYTKCDKKGTSKYQKSYNRLMEPESLKRIYESTKVSLKKSTELIKVSIDAGLENMFEDYRAWRRKGSKRPEYIFNMVQDIAFASYLPKIVKQHEDIIEKYGEEFSEILAAAVGELSKNKIAKSREMIGIYSKLYEEWNEDRIKRIFKMDLKGVDWEVALKLSITSHGTPRHTMINTLRVIYNNVKEREYDVLRKLLKKLYGEDDMPRVAVYIALERAYDRQKCAWIDREQYSVLTNIALDEINRQSKDEIKKLLKLYCEERRKSEYNELIHRRINFATINKDDYIKIIKVAHKLGKENQLYWLFLDQNKVQPKKK